MTIIITSRRNGFRRCGIAHPDKATPYPDDFFTQEQLKALGKEPQLILAYSEEDVDQVKDLIHESLPKTVPSQTAVAAQTAQSQLLETSLAPVGDAASLLLGKVEPPADLQPSSVDGQLTGPVLGADNGWEDAHLEDQAREADKLLAAWDEAHQEELGREAAKVKAAKPAAKAGKGPSDKARDSAK